MRPDPSPLWLVPCGVAVALLGFSYVAWGNWIPFEQTINNPQALGWLIVGVGALLAITGICLRVLAAVYPKGRR